MEAEREQSPWSRRVLGVGESMESESRWSRRVEESRVEESKSRSSGRSSLCPRHGSCLRGAFYAVGGKGSSYRSELIHRVGRGGSFGVMFRSASQTVSSRFLRRRHKLRPRRRTTPTVSTRRDFRLVRFDSWAFDSLTPRLPDSADSSTLPAPDSLRLLDSKISTRAFDSLTPRPILNVLPGHLDSARLMEDL